MYAVFHLVLVKFIKFLFNYFRVENFIKLISFIRFPHFLTVIFFIYFVGIVHNLSLQFTSNIRVHSRVILFGNSWAKGQHDKGGHEPPSHLHTGFSRLIYIIKSSFVIIGALPDFYFT